MSNNPKVLIGVVTASQKDYCVEEFKQQLKDFSYDNYDVLIVDNSEDPSHIETFKDFEVIHSSRLFEDNTRKRGNEMLAECQNIVRARFLEGNYDYLFILESDVFIDKDIIQWGISYEAPVYTIAYPIKIAKYDAPSMCVQFIHKLRKRGVKGSFMNTCMLPPEITLPAVIKPLTEFKIGNNMHLTNTGLGCSIISRDVVEHLPFRIDMGNDLKTGNMTFSDTFFYADCLMKGIKVLFDNRLICKHIKNW